MKKVLMLLGALLFVSGCSGHQPRHYESRYAGGENTPFANLAYCRFVSGGAHRPSFYICPKNSIYTAGKANNCIWVSESSHRDGGYNQCSDNVMPSSGELVAARSGGSYQEERTATPKAAPPVERAMPSEPEWRDPAEPEMEELRSAAEIRLKDGGSVKYLDVKVRVSDKSQALFVCGLLNAKNSYGAYVGYRPFLYMSDSTPDFSFLIEDGGSNRSVIEVFCRGAR